VVSQSGRERTLQVTELNSLVKITVHCDLGSGMQGHLSVTLHGAELDGVVSVDEA